MNIISGIFSSGPDKENVKADESIIFLRSFVSNVKIKPNTKIAKIPGTEYIIAKIKTGLVVQKETDWDKNRKTGLFIDKFEIEVDDKEAYEMAKLYFESLKELSFKDCQAIVNGKGSKESSFGDGTDKVTYLIAKTSNGYVVQKKTDYASNKNSGLFISDDGKTIKFDGDLNCLKTINNCSTSKASSEKLYQGLIKIKMKKKIEQAKVDPEGKKELKKSEIKTTNIIKEIGSKESIKVKPSEGEKVSIDKINEELKKTTSSVKQKPMTVEESRKQFKIFYDIIMDPSQFKEDDFKDLKTFATAYQKVMKKLDDLLLVSESNLSKDLLLDAKKQLQSIYGNLAKIGG